MLEQLKHLQQEQILQPLATLASAGMGVVASIAAVCVTGLFAWQQTKIASGQAEVAKEKLRLDFYDRRIEIFTSALTFYNAIVRWDGEGTPEQQEAQKRFLHAYSVSRFLFNYTSDTNEHREMRSKFSMAYSSLDVEKSLKLLDVKTSNITDIGTLLTLLDIVGAAVVGFRKYREAYTDPDYRKRLDNLTQEIALKASEIIDQLTVAMDPDLGFPKGV
jgi:hypothetical protein